MKSDFMLFTPGVDTEQNARVRLLKINICSNESSTAVNFLSGLYQVLRKNLVAVSFERDLKVKADYIEPTALFGFSARFFKGQLTDDRDRIKSATRFGITRPVPSCLRQMRAREDYRFRELRSQKLVAGKESDILIILESSERETAGPVLKKIREDELRGKIILKAVYEGFLPQDGKNAFGIKEGISNMQDLRVSSPDEYKSHIFVKNGEAGNADYDGGSYIVFRKYVLNVNHWFGNELIAENNRGKICKGEEARDLVIGRSAKNGLVIDRRTNEFLRSEADEKQVSRTFDESHIKQANPRGRGKTNFGENVSVNKFRILRRGFPFTEIDSTADKEIHGLLFLCFQSDIQKRGFEFIHNEWLMSDFMGGKDRLLDPKTGLVEPVDGCYYFCPTFLKFPGDVFFRDSEESNGT